MIRTVGLSFAFDDRSSFRLGPLDLTIPPGELIFWIGRNGSGKSTAARLLAGDLRPTYGEITTSHRLIYYGQQSSENIFSDLTLRQHCKLSGRASSEVERAIVTQFPALGTLMGRYPDELSGGQMQLFSFAQMLASASGHDGLILDEIFNHLHPDVREAVLSSLTRFVHKQNDKYCIIVSHERDTLRYADRIFVFEEGRISEEVRRDTVTEWIARYGIE